MQARPIFHYKEDPINAHLTDVFAALAIGRHLQELSGMSLKKLITTKASNQPFLINGDEIIILTDIPEDFKPILQTLKSTY